MNCVPLINASPSLARKVTGAIVSTLHGRVESSLLEQIRRKPTLAAYECVLHGIKHLRGYGPDDNKCAAEFFQQAIDLDPVVREQILLALKGAGLVNGRREGRCVYYRVEPRGMKPLIDWIAHYRAFWTEHIDRLEQLLEKMDE